MQGADFAGIDAAFRFTPEDRQIESQVKIPNLRLEQRDAKLQFRAALKREIAREILPTKPERGVSLHVVSNGKFDHWSFVPVLIEHLGGVADELLASTWTLNRTNAVELLALFDEGKIRSVGLVSGLYFKRRESSVYATILNGLRERGQRFVVFENHTKVTMLANHASGDYVVIEGSANLTSNPRSEQYVVNNDRELFEFHKSWMEAYLAK